MSLADLIDDLTDEQNSLESLLSDDSCDRPTPAVGWTVRDQISHLAFFDERTAMALRKREKFVAERDSIRNNDEYMAIHLRRGRETTGRELLEW